MILRKRFDSGPARFRKILKRSTLRTLLTGGFGVLLALCAVEAFARAGGGEGFGSGGSGSGGGGGSGGGNADLIFFLIELLLRLTIEYPAVGIPLALTIIAIVVYSAREGGERYVDYTIRRGVVAQDHVRRRRAEEALKKRDPAWNTGAMVSRAKTAFALIQEAWSDQKLEKAQAFLSDAIYEKFRLQIAELQKRGIRDRIDSITLHDARIAQLESDETFDTLHIYFRAHAANFKVDAKTGKRLSDDSGEFEEYWSFLRRPGAKTLAKGLIEGYCPNCSAPISMNRAAKCEVCNSFLRSGEYDWVLSEITQASAWSVREAVAVPGLDAMRRLDAGFSVQQMEDLASLAFYRHEAAVRLGTPETIAKLALDSFVEEFPAKIRKEPDGTRLYYTSCGVGSVDTKLIEPGEPMDRVWVEISWSGRTTRKMPDGREIVGGICPPRRHFSVFVRKHGVETDARLSLSSAHCPSCGAPEQNVTDNICPYCQTIRNDGSRGWVLEAVMPVNPDTFRTMMEKRVKQAAHAPAIGEAPGGVPPLPVPAIDDMGDEEPGAAELGLACMVHVMMADDVIDDREEKFLREFAARCKVRKDVVDSMIQQARVVGKMDDSSLPVPATPTQGKRLLRRMAAMALADGRLSKEERAALNAFASRIDLSPADVDLIVGQERSRIYAEAKKAITESRNVPS
ncbi:TIM44-like domain-containing protein [Candidatus Ozemobacteraceae bacterium]|nr:TIM44-like domain-containing protein [Candidatus Ozemobacteraceae bacterium]